VAESVRKKKEKENKLPQPSTYLCGCILVLTKRRKDVEFFFNSHKCEIVFPYFFQNLSFSLQMIRASFKRNRAWRNITNKITAPNNQCTTNKYYTYIDSKINFFNGLFFRLITLFNYLSIYFEDANNRLYIFL